MLSVVQLTFRYTRCGSVTRLNQDRILMVRLTGQHIYYGLASFNANKTVYTF